MFLITWQKIQKIPTRLNSYSDAGYLTGTSHVDRVMQAVFMGGAADQVPKNLRQIYRSHFAMLSQGHPPYTLPFYLDRDKRKQAIFNPRFLPVIEEMLRRWLDDENYAGTKVIAQKINQLRDAEGRPYRAPKNEHGLWPEATVRFNMMNPLVYGCVSIWGREWPLAAGEQVTDYKSPLLRPEPGEKVAPLALIAKSQWEKAIRGRIRQHPHKHGRTVSNTQALTGLIKCRCGATLYFHTRVSGYRSDHWTCHAERDVKSAIEEKSGLVWHLGLSNGEISAFFRDLFQEAPHLLRSNAVETYAELDAKHQDLVAEREEIRAHLADNARQKALHIFPENNPGYQGVYVAVLKGFEADEAYQRLLARIQRVEEQKRQKEVEKYRGEAAEERDFATLPPKRQNQILKSYIHEIVIVSPFGHTDLRDESLLVKLRSGGELEIPLRSKMYKNGCPRLSVPPFFDWLLSVQSVQESDGG